MSTTTPQRSQASLLAYRRRAIELASGAFLTLLAAGHPPLSAQAAPTIIYGTGQAESGTQAVPGRDAHWQVVAAPTQFTPPDGQTYPYAAYVVQTAEGVWLGGGGNPQTGITFGTGQDAVTNYWISPAPTVGSIATGNYNWIVAQTFNVQQAGTYSFNFAGTGDNAISFFINGSVTGSGTNLPTISGGTQIGGQHNNFGTLGTFTGSAVMQAGVNTAYMVLYDFGGSTGAIIQQSSFEYSGPAPAPAPIPILGAAAAFRASRRLKQRIHLSRAATISADI